MSDEIVRQVAAIIDCGSGPACDGCRVEAEEIVKLVRHDVLLEVLGTLTDKVESAQKNFDRSPDWEWGVKESFAAIREMKEQSE